MPESKPSDIPGGEVTEFWSVPRASIPAIRSVSLLPHIRSELADRSCEKLGWCRRLRRIDRGPRALWLPPGAWL